MAAKKSANAFASIITVLLLTLSAHLLAQAEPDYTAVTASDVQISVDDLNSLLLPLTKAELEVEAQAWQEVLARKVQQIGELEIQVRDASAQQAGLIGRVGEQIIGEVTQVIPGENGDNQGATDAGTAGIPQNAPPADKSAGRPAPAQTAEPGSGNPPGDVPTEAATQLEAALAQARLEQGGINKRFETVLDALEAKGGDVKDQRLYLSAVSGIKLDINSSGAGLLMVKEWMKSRDGGLLVLMNLLKFAVAIAFVAFLARLAGRLTDRVLSRRPMSILLENFMKVAIRRTVLAVGIICALPLIGIDVGPVLALIGAAGLVIGLALQGTLSNFASGVLILVYRPYDMNDAVEVGDVTGIVHSMNLLFTTIKTFDNQLITIPNNSIWNDAITNITGSQERRVDMVFGIGYSDDFHQAQQILHTILKAHPKVLDAPEAKIRVNELADSSVNIICRPWAKTEDYWDVYWDVTESAKREFDKQNISIPFPQRDVHLYTAATEATGKPA